MQIILVQAEIETAIRNYVNSKVKVNEGQDIRIDLSASRGPEGFRATIDIIDDDLTPAVASKAAAAKANTESSDDLAAATKAKAVEVEAKKKSDMAAAAEQAAPKKEQEQVREATAVAVAKQATTDEPGEGITEPPFEPDAKEETQATTTAEPEANGQPIAPRKPLFGRSNAALNA